MPEHGPCEICGNPAEHDRVPGWTERRNCPRCGMFEYDEAARWQITSPGEMVRLSGWVRDQNAAGVMPVRITPEIRRRVSKMRLPGLRERANRGLCLVARKYPDLTQPTAFDQIALDLDFQALTYSGTLDEAMRLIHVLLDDGCLRGFLNTVTNRATTGALTAKGMLTADDLRSSTSSSAQGFVAMWFDQSLRDAWTNGFDPGIRGAGFQPIRIDNKDYVSGITDEIMAEIRRSRFVVADYTGQVNGVYFEAGFALGLGLTVIPTCRADEVPKLHFDIKHLNTLLWNTPVELAGGLNRRIRAVIGAGPDAADP